METIHILLISCTTESDVDTRNLCNLLETQTISIEDLETFLNRNKVTKNEWNIYELSDYMELVNDGDLDILTESFLSYVKIKELTNN